MHDNFWLTAFLCMSDRMGRLWFLKGNKKYEMHFSVFRWEIIVIFNRNLQDSATGDTPQISAMREEEWKMQ